MDKKDVITFDEMFKALQKADKQLREYLQIGDELSAIQPTEYGDNYLRDMNHPLSLSIYD